ncbi:hypothetical protein K523DRAFT_319548, partial [Schizophyllum commune Tattone D]
MRTRPARFCHYNAHSIRRPRAFVTRYLEIALSSRFPSPSIPAVQVSTLTSLLLHRIGMPSPYAGCWHHRLLQILHI